MVIAGLRDGATHWRHLKPGSARSSVLALVRRRCAVALPPLGPAHHIDRPTVAAGTAQPLAPVEDGRFGPIPARLFRRGRAQPDAGSLHQTINRTCAA